MKHIVILLAFLFSASYAIADSDDYDLNAELKSAKRLIYKERYKKAIKKLKKAVKEEPGNADAWNLLGFASRKKGDLEKSASAYTKALEIEPDHKGALEYQGELFLLQGDKAAATTNLEKLTALCPDGCEQIEQLTQAIANSP